MNLSQYVRCLRQLWPLVVLATVLGALAGVVAAIVVPNSLSLIHI